ncbi:MAG: DUF4097 family beta strand repeat-containing protein [Candidatus Izemoplasmataceae bacterium]
MKERFMNQLEMYLQALSEEERREILDFYEERFYTGKLYEGKSEAEIVSELESPEAIARNVLKEYGKPFDSRTYKTQGDGLKVGSLVGVVLFDMFIVSWFVPALFSLIVGFLGGMGGLMLSLVLIPFNGMEGSLGMVLVGAGLLFFGVLLVLWLYDILLTFIAWLLKWHLEALNLEVNDWPRRIRNLRASTFLKRRPKTNKLKNQLKFVALLLVLIGGAYQIVNFNTLRFNLGAEELTTETTEEAITDLEGWAVRGDLGHGDLAFHTHDQDSIRIESVVPEDSDMEITIDKTDKTIIMTQDINYFSLNIGQWIQAFSNDTFIDVYLPEDLTLNNVDMDHVNGDIELSGYDVEGLNLSTTNGDIRLDSMTSSSPIRAFTTNGNVIIRSSSAYDLEVSSTNGNADIRNGQFDNIDASTTNGKVVLQDINDESATDTVLVARTTNGNIEFENVYVNRVSMKSTNGSLSYSNDAASFTLDSLLYDTTNGSTDIDVPHVRD